MDGPAERWNEWRNQIIGLGNQSARKNYYAELQKRVEELRVSEADLRTLFDNVTDAIFIHDEQGRVEDVNNAMLEMYRVTREEALRFTMADYSAPGPQLQWLPGALAGLRHTAGRLLFEWKARRPLDGSLFDVEVGSRPTRWKNQPMVVALVRDITKRKQAEAERDKLQALLTQAQKMESIGRLAGGVAHDFNNMLQAILGNAALALDGLPLDHPSCEYLEEIEKSAKRSADLTHQLLAFARKQTIQPKILDLNDTVAGMLKMLRRLIGEDIDLAWMPGADLWTINIDPAQVDQILANLCVNARDAIDTSGKVVIKTDNVTLDELSVFGHPDCLPGDYVLLAVTDTGHGMSEETRSHLFEPFFTTKEVGKGTGLGLATVFGIVKQNGGLIRVLTEVGQGTTFNVYLPRAAAPLPSAELTAAERSVRGTETVLVVEDEDQILALGRRILTQQGYTVLAAATPMAALAAVTQYTGPIHLLVTDVVMPGMNGKELKERLRLRYPGLKTLFMSGYTADVIAHHGVLEQGVEFIQKPFTNRALAEKVREVLDANTGSKGG